jgi:hypothetical protein
MNKKIAILLLFSGILNYKTKAQYVYEPDDSINNYWGLQTKLIDYFPIELSYIHSQNSRISYLFKLSYVKPFDVKFSNANSYKLYSVANASNFESIKSSNAFSSKIGIMLWHFYDDDLGLRYISLNGTCTYASEKITITTNDVIYGKTITNYNENNIFSTIELETQKVTSYGLSFGLIAGYKTINPTPFGSIINGIENITTYSPGAGFGSKLYFNIQVGYHFKFKKRK